MFFFRNTLFSVFRFSLKKFLLKWVKQKKKLSIERKAKIVKSGLHEIVILFTDRWIHNRKITKKKWKTTMDSHTIWKRLHDSKYKNIHIQIAIACNSAWMLRFFFVFFLDKFLLLKASLDEEIADHLFVMQSIFA